MKRVVRTKQPSLTQMSNMAFNLREKFHKSAKVAIAFWAFNSEHKVSIEFGMWMDGVSSHLSSPWKDIQDKYFELMEI